MSFSTETSYKRAITKAGDPIAFSVKCPVPDIAWALVSTLERQGFRHDPTATIVIVLDIPRGFAPYTLQTGVPTGHCLIVATWSFSPEYWEDLWDMRPDVLLVGDGFSLDMATALTRVAHGAQYRMIPAITTPLTPAERRMLRLLAHGRSNQQIAEELSMQLQSIKNALTIIFQKIGVKNRNEALLYYWGIWHMFVSRQPTLMEKYVGQVD